VRIISTLDGRTVKNLPVGVALFLLVSGSLAIIFPRPLVIGHAGSGRYGGISLFRLEQISKTGCRTYGVLAVVVGTVMMWGAVGDSCVPLTDRRIAKSIVITKSALERDYGMTDDCTILQIEVAVKASKVSPKHLPYLCAAFMGKDGFGQLRESMPDVDWNGIERTVSRIATELPYKELKGGHFHESWIASVDY
jgi:hypothetical protein